MTAHTQVSRLDCRHLVYYVPGPLTGDRVYCRDCREYRVVKIASVEWRWYCIICNTGRQFGVDELAARQSAQRHLNRFSSHTVDLHHGGDKIEHLNGPQEEQLFDTET